MGSNGDPPLRERAMTAAAASLNGAPAHIQRPLLESRSSTASSVASSREGSPEATTTITTVHHRPKNRSAAAGEETEGEDGPASTTEIRHTGGRVTHEVGKDGSLSIRPVAQRTRSGKARVKIRKVVNFKHRTSTFDRFNAASTSDQFRGFYTLFWIFLAVAMFRTLQSSYDDRGHVIGMGFFRLFSEDAKVLALTDAVLVGSSFACVPFAKALQKGWIRYHYTGLVVQHICQALWLGLWIRWTFFRQWPWVQSGFLVLHALSMLMKIHSYCAINGDLSERHRRSRNVLAELEKAVEKRGGWDVVVAEAEQGKRTAEGQNGHADPYEGVVGEEERRRVEGRVADEEGLHRRRTPSAQRIAISTSLTSDATRSKSPTSPRHRGRRSSMPHTSPGVALGVERSRVATAEAVRLQLVADYHPDSHEGEGGAGIADLAGEAAEGLEALTSTVDGVITWPDNITFANFWDYLLVPSLVYDIAFPRTQGIRPLYILEKVAATIGIFSLLYIVTQAYVWDRYPKPEDGFVAGYATLIIPFMINYLLLFLIIFECICNAFAEFTRFADREFYSDWWNSTSFEEFSRKWNKPVHNFLLRHVYASTISAYGLSKSQAALVTFFLSAVMHELLMAVVTKKIRMYLFAMQMAQLPLITLGQAKFFKEHPSLGNLVFWIGLMSGFPLLGVCYILY